MQHFKHVHPPSVRLSPPGQCFVLCQGQKVGGHYYKGSVLSVDEPLDGDEADPWCSITVLWDNEEDDSSQHTAKHKVTPAADKCSQQLMLA